MIEVLTHRVPAEARGERLDQHLSAVLAGFTRSRLKGLIDQGQVRLGGRAAKASQRLKGGEMVVIQVPPPPPLGATPEDLPLQFLHEDEDLLVLDKAAGMVVHPAPGNRGGTLVNALLHRLGSLPGERARPGLVHRLDKETSGCLVVAKHEEALRSLQAAFKSRRVEKVYLALVHGAPPGERTLRTLHGRHPRDRKRFTAKVQVGRAAVTHYRVLQQFEGAALLEVRLETGRTHQIRVHLSESGYPLLVDALYGGLKQKAPERIRQAQEALGRLGLHAQRLSFPHPRSGEILSVEAPLPLDFQRALAVLRAPTRSS